jgi:hypothetical protein
MNCNSIVENVSRPNITVRNDSLDEGYRHTSGRFR